MFEITTHDEALIKIVKLSKNIFVNIYDITSVRLLESNNYPTKYGILVLTRKTEYTISKKKQKIS